MKPVTFEHALPIAEIAAAGQRHGLSAYDASDLVLARRLGARLATLDARRAAAATRPGVPAFAEP